MYFQLIPRVCGSLFALFYLRWLDAFRFAKCGTNPVFLWYHFYIRLTIASSEHTKWDACHATQTCKNMAKWTTIYLFSLNIQHFIGHSLEYHNKILYTVCTTGGHKLFSLQHTNYTANFSLAQQYSVQSFIAICRFSFIAKCLWCQSLLKVDHFFSRFYFIFSHYFFVLAEELRKIFSIWFKVKEVLMLKNCYFFTCRFHVCQIKHVYFENKQLDKIFWWIYCLTSLIWRLQMKINLSTELRLCFQSFSSLKWIDDMQNLKCNEKSIFTVPEWRNSSFHFTSLFLALMISCNLNSFIFPASAMFPFE